ncbi:MAG: hypothetical protein QNL04_05700 [SAR324 cluster bacterium]|nr:hypothetical protein [SAR324 cluster bacterium]
MRFKKTTQLNRQIIEIFLLFTLAAISFVARFIHLDTHFSHIDDLLIPTTLLHNSPVGFLDIFSFAADSSHYSTYAPLQFILTGLINKNLLDYKEMLFWTRLPSLVMAMASLLAIFQLNLKIYKDKYFLPCLVSFTILAFSWVNIIYSMQSESYTISVWTVLVNFWLFFHYLNKEKITFLELPILGILLSILACSSYQFFIFLPGFFLGIFLNYNKRILDFFRDHLISLFILAFAIFAIYKRWLSVRLGRGIHWNVGPNQEYLLRLPAENDLFENVIYIATFFSKNLYIVFRHITSFAAEGWLFNDIFAVIYLLLFIIGVYSWVTSTSKAKKLFVVTFLTTSVLWAGLLIERKMALSPTRHSMILLGYVLVFTPAGMLFLYEKFKLSCFHQRVITVSFSVIVFVIFAMSYNPVMSKRMDKFVPEKIEGIIRKFNITEIYQYGWTRNLLFMNHIRENFTTSRRRRTSAKRKKIVSWRKKAILAVYRSKKKNASNGAVLFITHRELVLSKKIKDSFLSHTKRSSETKFTTIYSEENRSNTEIGFGNLTKNGTNSLFYYVVKLE